VWTTHFELATTSDSVENKPGHFALFLLSPFRLPPGKSNGRWLSYQLAHSIPTADRKESLRCMPSTSARSSSASATTETSRLKYKGWLPKLLEEKENSRLSHDPTILSWTESTPVVLSHAMRACTAWVWGIIYNHSCGAVLCLREHTAYCIWSCTIYWLSWKITTIGTMTEKKYSKSKVA